MNFKNFNLSLLTDLLPAQYRKAVHTLLTLLLAVLTIWAAAEGDWDVFVTTLLAALYTASNQANTFETPPEDVPFVAHESHDEHDPEVQELEYKSEDLEDGTL